MLNVSTTLNYNVHQPNDTNTFLRAAFALLLRAGFILIQLGCVPSNNIYIILLQNIVDIAICIISYGFFGYNFSFGRESLFGIVGYNDNWIKIATGTNSTSIIDFDQAVYGFSACLIGTAIIATFLSGRVTFATIFFITFIYTAFLQSTIMHWIWHPSGIMTNYHIFNKRVAIKDHGGAIVVHISSGVTGLVGALILGRRILKLSELDDFSIKSESAGSTITGYFFVLIGLIAFSLPIRIIHYPITGLIMVNNLMAIAAGILVVTVMHLLVYKDMFKYWIIIRCMQGSLAGVVSIAAGVDVYSPLIAFGISAAAALIYFLISFGLHHTCLEDSCNITAIHLVCGILGVLLPALFAERAERLGFSVGWDYRLVDLIWQAICAGIVIVVFLIVFTFLFVLFMGCGFLRNYYERINHYRGFALELNLPGRFFAKRLFGIKANSSFVSPNVNNDFVNPRESDFSAKRTIDESIFTEFENMRNASTDFDEINSDVFTISVDKCDFDMMDSVSVEASRYGKNSLKNMHFDLEQGEVVALRKTVKQARLEEGDTEIGGSSLVVVKEATELKDLTDDED